MSTAERTRFEHEWPTIGALGVLAVLSTVLVGPVGTVAAAVTALVWYGLGTPYALAAGHVVLAAGLPSGVGPVSIALVELGFVAVLLAATVRRTTPLRDGAVTLASVAGLVGTAWLVGRSRPLWLAAGTLLVVFALAAYALHRYELVRLGLVPDDGVADTPDERQRTDVTDHS